jgi:hypothetical protein
MHSKVTIVAIAALALAVVAVLLLTYPSQRYRATASVPPSTTSIPYPYISQTQGAELIGGNGTYSASTLNASGIAQLGPPFYGNATKAWIASYRSNRGSIQELVFTMQTVNSIIPQSFITSQLSTNATSPESFSASQYGGGYAYSLKRINSESGAEIIGNQGNYGYIITILLTNVSSTSHLEAAAFFAVNMAANDISSYQ